MKKLISLFKDFGAGIGSRKLPLYSAAGAYKIFVSIVPVVMLIVSVVRFLPISEEYIISQLNTVMPEQAMTILKRIISGIYKSGSAALTVSTLLTLYSASASMREIMNGLNAAYNVEKPRNIFKYYGSSVIYMAGLVATLVLSFFILAYGGRIMSVISAHFPENTALINLFAVLKYARFLIAAVILFFAFLVMFKFVPAGKRKMSEQCYGALFTAVAWVAFSVVFSIYISFSNKFGAYGIIGSVLVAMMWLYYNILFIFIGGWVNCFVKEKRIEKEK